MRHTHLANPPFFSSRSSADAVTQDQEALGKGEGTTGRSCKVAQRTRQIEKPIASKKKRIVCGARHRGVSRMQLVNSLEVVEPLS